MPALLAVHNSAPSDPSVPLQKAYDTYSSHANKSASVQHTQQQSKHSSAQRQTGSNDQIAEDHAAASSSDMHAVFDTKPDRVEALNATSARHATVSMLPRLREIQRKARSDPDVQAALRQNLSQGADLDDDVQILPRVFYTDAAFAGSLMQQAVASSPAASDPALQELDENTKSQSSTSTPAGLSEQSLPTAYHQQTSESDNQRGSVDGALNESMRDVAKLDLLKLKISCGHMQWQADSSGSSNIGSEAFLPSIDLLQQFASPSGYEQPAGVSLDQQSAQGAASHHAQPEQQLQDHSGSLPGHVPHPQTGNAGEFANKGVSDKQSFSSDNEDSAEHKDDIRMLGTEPYDKDAMDPDLDREATLNLDGAQVLTPDGEWQRVNRKARVGSAWTKGECMTIGTTTEYELSAVSRKIICVTSGWGTIDAYALNVQDVMDAYIKAVGLDSFDMQAFVCAD